MESIWQYGGYGMNFIKFLQRINWVWIGLIMMSFTIWYFLIKLIRSLI